MLGNIEASTRPGSADRAWLTLLTAIKYNGREAAPRGLRILERLAEKTELLMVRPVVAAKARKLGYRFMAAEALWILEGRNDVAELAKYSPHIAAFSDDGHRLDGAYGPMVVDQLRYVVDSLCADRDTRQAVIGIWRRNPRPSKDISCTLSLQWLVRDGALNCVDTMRSSDAWLGWPYDVFSFSMLSAYVALLLRERGVEVGLGCLLLVAGSSHLYVDPAADGHGHIPYTLKDVDKVLAGPEPSGLVECHPYKDFKLNAFASPEALLEHLRAMRDLHDQDGRSAWLDVLMGHRG